MDILDKLKYYQNSSQSKSKIKRKSNLDDLAKHLNAHILAENSPPIIKRESVYTLEQILNENRKIDSINLSLLSLGQFNKPINPYDLLFFDLETTGLAGGAGIYPFVLGFAFFTNHGFKVIQYFLPEYDRDIFVYLDLKDIINSTSILASFNGKSYDYPLLKTRFILNRFTDIFANFLHLDLLHLSRRLWKNSLENCSLQNIEQEIFKFHRIGDIAGYLIPQSYFNYLRTGNFVDVKNIIFHNEQDLISLVRLVFHLSNVENETGLFPISNAEYQSLAYNAIRTNNLKLTQRYMNEIRRQNIPVSDKIQLEYSLLLKKNTIWVEALEIWQDFIKRGTHVLFSLEELAKYYEHFAKNYDKAQECTIRALKYLEILSEIECMNSIHLNNQKVAFDYRMKRVSKKNRNVNK